MRVRAPAFGLATLALLLSPATLSAVDVRDVAGEWDSDSGWVVLEASPKPGKPAIAVSGYWIQDTDKKGLIPSGTFHPARRTLEFEFTQSWNKKHGTATFALSPDGRTFKGTWRHEGGEGEWLLRRVRGKTFEAKVDSLVAYAGVRRDGAGGAVMVIEDGRVLLQKGYGYAHIATRKPNTAQTSFELASVAKQFTAAAIMIFAISASSHFTMTCASTSPSYRSIARAPFGSSICCTTRRACRNMATSRFRRLPAAGRPLSATKTSPASLPASGPSFPSSSRLASATITTTAGTCCWP